MPLAHSVVKDALLRPDQITAVPHNVVQQTWLLCNQAAVQDGCFLHETQSVMQQKGGQLKLIISWAQVGSILEAMVATVKPFGLFVRLKGYRANGLVHLSQVG